MASDRAYGPALERLRRYLDARQWAIGDPRLTEDDDRWDTYPCDGGPAKSGAR